MLTEKEKDAVGIKSSLLLQAIISYSSISKCGRLHTVEQLSVPRVLQ